MRPKGPPPLGVLKSAVFLVTGRQHSEFLYDCFAVDTQETQMNRMIKAALALCAPIVLLTSQPAAAQDAWPSRTVRIVTPSPAGVGTDAFARIYAEQLGKALNASVIVENKPGAAGTLGTDTVAKAAADGYTLLLTTSLPITVAPHLFPRLPYRADKDLVPVAMLYRGGSFVIAGPAFSGQTLKDLVTQAKQKPDSILYASYGSGSTAHLSMEQFQDAADIKLVHVPYKQTAITDIAGGQVAIGFEPPVSALPNIKSGRVRALAYTGDKRSAALPNVPTVSELYPGVEFFTSVGVWVPQGTPEAIVKKLNAAFNAATKSPEVAKALADAGVDGLNSTPAKMQTTIAEELDRLGKLIKAKNITLN